MPIALGCIGTLHRGWPADRVPLTCRWVTLPNGCARRSPTESSGDAGSTPATSTHSLTHTEHTQSLLVLVTDLAAEVLGCIAGGCGDLDDRVVSLVVLEAQRA
jgi:hypothetical protein